MNNITEFNEIISNAKNKDRNCCTVIALAAARNISFDCAQWLMEIHCNRQRNQGVNFYTLIQQSQKLFPQHQVKFIMDNKAITKFLPWWFIRLFLNKNKTYYIRGYKDGVGGHAFCYKGGKRIDILKVNWKIDLIIEVIP